LVQDAQLCVLRRKSSQNVHHLSVQKLCKSGFVCAEFRSEIAFGGEILLRRVKCFATQNVKYFIFDEMLRTGFARTPFKMPAIRLPLGEAVTAQP